MDAASYGGRENLEAMEAAVNYNRSLVGLVEAYLPRAARVLDFGAGSGTLTRLLRDAGFDMLALEPDGALAGALESDGIPVEPRLDSIPDGTLGAIVSFNVLEHIEDDAAALRSLHAKLCAGGRLLLYVPAFPLLYSSMDRKVGHFRRYRRRGLVSLLERSGFSVEAARHLDSLGFIAALAYRFAAPGDGVLQASAVRTYDRFLFPVSRMVDRLTAGAIGKNLFAVCTKRDRSVLRESR